MSSYGFLHTVFLFFLYSFLGWCVEVAYAAITTRRLVNRGFLNGPVCPIYGCGMTVMIFLLGRFSIPMPGAADPWYVRLIAVFFGGMIITTLTELVGGYLLYKLFHTRWWDYSSYRFNLGGFICPQFSLLWGIGSVILMLFVHPLLNGSSAHIPRQVLLGVDLTVGLLFAADLAASVVQAVGLGRQLARIDDVRAGLRRVSDALTGVIGTGAMTVDTLLDEQKLQLTLGAMEGRDNAAELGGQLRDLADKAREVRRASVQMSRQKFFGTGRLLRAFPDMVPDRREAMVALRAALSRAASAARQAVSDNVQDWKNGLRKDR